MKHYTILTTFINFYFTELNYEVLNYNKIETSSYTPDLAVDF